MSTRTGLRLSDFDFELPPERIAQAPARPRDAARLLVVGAALEDRCVGELPALLRAGDILVANDTRVIPAQLAAHRGEARIGLTLDRPLPDGSWHALARNARRLRAGDRLSLDGAPETGVDILTRDEDGGVTLRFGCEEAELPALLRRAGALALPPYIARPSGPTEDDAADYQTLFAAHPGAVAAPTAGLHFTPALMAGLAAAGVGRALVTLHVGAGTFLPVRTDAVDEHRMHPEYGSVSARAAVAINQARAAGGRVVAVGTTSLRLLETATGEDRLVRPFDGETDLFLLPGSAFRAADLLLTNFHLPRSTLFMLVCGFAGEARMRAAYAHAIEAGYRFYSYGDASLLSRAP